MVSNSILCQAISSGIPFKSFYVQTNTPLSSLRSSISCYVTTGSNAEFIFTYYTFSLVPKFILVSCSSLVAIQFVMVRSYTRFWASVSSMIISPTFGWNFFSSRCCSTILGGITRLIAKTHNGSTRCFGIGSTILRFGMKIGLVIGSI